MHCLQSVKERDAETGSSTGKSKSINESIFAATHAELLKPIYKVYQAMQFATHCPSFLWDAVHRKAGVQPALRSKGVSLPRKKPKPVSSTSPVVLGAGARPQ